jgi:hypothetical protein
MKITRVRKEGEGLSVCMVEFGDCDGLSEADFCGCARVTEDVNEGTGSFCEFRPEFGSF